MALQNGSSKPLGLEREISAILKGILDAIREVRYGSVKIHIQDGRVVQIDKIIKSRIR